METKEQVVILLLRESAVERGWARRWVVTPTIFHHLISLQIMTTTFEPRSPPLSSLWDESYPPAPPGWVPEGEVERGCRRMCWVIILSNIPHTQLSNPPRCRRDYLNEARRSSEGRGQRVLNDL
jgi:hypothetical protein